MSEFKHWLRRAKEDSTKAYCKSFSYAPSTIESLSHSVMSTSSNISQSTYSPSEPETPQSSAPRLQNFDQSMNHVDLGISIEQSLKSAQNEMHQKRIQLLRKELDYLKTTEWEFEYDKGFLQ
ncbi:hypothetical protein K1T71_001775 [Dendrolimus kikuchii]|uniref:Uncharacterized protein n=1 Tax=Dendrolimus kikuchii TaxID=765133 RepID=A0ACC1DF08_9NEOP|nr:hypothetical protein K1T71_001775 [Dendrolimus kikuchii]